MEEGSLYRYIKNKEKLEEDETVQKLGEICEAVSYMHRNDILHRDLKPENVVMSHVHIRVCREFVKYAILDGPSAARPSERRAVGLSIILAPKSQQGPPTQNRSMSGP